MKKIIFLFLILLIVAGYLFLRFKLSSLLAMQLSKSLQRPVSIGSVDLSLPLSFSIKNLVIFDSLTEKKDTKFLSIDRIRFTPALIPFLRGKAVFYSLIIDQPHLKIVRIAGDKFNFSDILSTSEKKRETKVLPLLVLRLKINKGELNFIDKSLGEPPLSIVLRDINLSIKKLILPLTDVVTDYVLKAKLGEAGIEEEGEVNSSGWLNFTRKDMEAKFSLHNLDYLYLKPYLGKVISGKINQGIVNLYADIFSQNNDLNLKCKLELDKLIAEENSSQIFGVSLEKVIETFKDKDGKVIFDFEIKTKFDKPSIDYAKIGEQLWKQIADKLARKAPLFILEKVSETTKEGVEELITNPLKEIKKKLQEPLKE
ncbi:MAG: DUF748 domain-containing protein [Candidatus Omnitrophica bacterium]|nr:DUF748 domain-containing protein [Candidatus Omnitrophota bacterium]